MKRLIIVMLFVTVPVLINAQSRFKSYRNEVHIGIGVSNFLGELGGANQIGTDGFRDLELLETRLAFAVGLRHRMSERFSINPTFSYGRLSGDDDLTLEFFRRYRNLNFKTNIYELSCNLEVAIIKDKTGARYRLKGVRGHKAYELSMYGFLGFGGFYFNPKGEYQDKWVELQPLRTENIRYNRLQFVVPVGVGIKYGIDRRWSVGFQYGLRKTFTDYIDDVSTVYADPDILRSNYGELSAYMANKSNGDFPYITAVGEQRGDPTDKDSYMFAIFNLNYKIRTTRSSPTF